MFAPPSSSAKLIEHQPEVDSLIGWSSGKFWEILTLLANWLRNHFSPGDELIRQRVVTRDSRTVSADG
jgi:hypothetical protein